MAQPQKLLIKHDGNPFEADGLRDQFVYRDLGLTEATGGDYMAHVIRAGDGQPPIETHQHPEIKFQFVYVLKGEVTFWYEGRGEETLKAGSCHLLPPGIKHSVEGWSDDLEMIEIASPSVFSSVEVERE
jgi:quercetin dioxygenase-like cupin family protein